MIAAFSVLEAFFDFSANLVTFFARDFRRRSSRWRSVPAIVSQILYCCIKSPGNYRLAAQLFRDEPLLIGYKLPLTGQNVNEINLEFV